MAKIVVIQGPNINLLGYGVNVEKFGPMKLEEVHKQMEMVADDNKLEIEFFQSNLEGEIIDKIQECLGDADGIIINPNGLGESETIKEALEVVNIPTIYVELEKTQGKLAKIHNNIGNINGFGAFGYHLAMLSLVQFLFDIKQNQTQTTNSVNNPTPVNAQVE